MKCGAPADVLRYRAPTTGSRVIVILRTLLVVSAAFSIISAVRAFFDAMEVSAVVDQLLHFAVQDTTPELAPLRDGIRMASNATVLLGYVAIAAVFFIPVRYLYLAWVVGHGSPTTLRQIRLVAALAFTITLAKTLAVVFIGRDNEAIDLGIHWWLEANLLLAPTLFAYTLTPAARDQFSAFRLEPADEPVESCSACAAPLRHGARFCSRCGAAAAPGAPP